MPGREFCCPIRGQSRQDREGGNRVRAMIVRRDHEVTLCAPSACRNSTT
jgi:hypothetical protein